MLKSKKVGIKHFKKIEILFIDKDNIKEKIKINHPECFIFSAVGEIDFQNNNFKNFKKFFAIEWGSISNLFTALTLILEDYIQRLPVQIRTTSVETIYMLLKTFAKSKKIIKNIPHKNKKKPIDISKIDLNKLKKIFE